MSVLTWAQKSLYITVPSSPDIHQLRERADMRLNRPWWARWHPATLQGAALWYVPRSDTSAPRGDDALEPLLLCVAFKSIFCSHFYSLVNPNFTLTVTPTSYRWMLPLIPELPHTLRLTHDTEQVYSCWLQVHVIYMGCMCALQDACTHAQISRYKPAPHPSAFVWTCQHLSRGRTYRNIIRLIMTHSAQINTH